jgi:hypothetical protein
MLSLFLGRYLIFLRLLWMEMFSYILCQSVHCWCIRKLLIFVSWFSIVILCWSCLWHLGVFWCSVVGLLGIRSCYIDLDFYI